MAGFVLKVKTKSGQKLVNGLTPKTKVCELKSKLSEITGIPQGGLHILSGFPPKPLNLDKGDAALDEAGISSGDTLIIEEKPIPAQIKEKRCDESIPRSHIVDQENFNTAGVLMKKIVPSDNSCLFTSVGYVLNGKTTASRSKLLPDSHSLIFVKQVKSTRAAPTSCAA